MRSTTKNGKSEMDKLYGTDGNGKMGQSLWDGGSNIYSFEIHPLSSNNINNDSFTI